MLDNRLVKTVLILSSFLLSISLVIKPISAEEICDAEYLYVYDYTNSKELYVRKEGEKMYPASMTKIMTVLLALETVSSLDERVEVKEEDLKGLVEEEASLADLKVGESISIRDLLYGAMLVSGCDSCRVLARYIAGDENKFALLMTIRARELGLKHTIFTNSSGLDQGYLYTTVDDIGKLTCIALENPLFKEIYTTHVYVGENHTYKSFKERYANKYNTSKIIGSKTGMADAALYTISALVRSGDRELVVIIGHDQNRKIEMQRLNQVIAYYGG